MTGLQREVGRDHLRVVRLGAVLEAGRLPPKDLGSAVDTEVAPP